jgi:hypothetical protein
MNISELVKPIAIGQVISIPDRGTYRVTVFYRGNPVLVSTSKPHVRLEENVHLANYYLDIGEWTIVKG